MKKQELLQLLEEQPEELDVDELLYTLYVRRTIELGETSPESDDLSAEEFAKEIAEWLA